MSISVRDITKRYGSQIAVNKVSFSIGKGEIVAFIGPNGAGKSTTMKIITGTLPPDSGEVMINDLPIIENQNKIKKIIGYLPENNPLYVEMYIREYLIYVAGLYGIKQSAARNRTNEVIQMTGLEPESHKKISNLNKNKSFLQ